MTAKSAFICGLAIVWNATASAYLNPACLFRNVDTYDSFTDFVFGHCWCTTNAPTHDGYGFAIGSLSISGGSGCPGRTQVLTASGGGDLDWADEGQKPCGETAYCGGPGFTDCNPQQVCDPVGHAECKVPVNNSAMEYEWEVSGYVDEVYEDVDSLLTKKCYVRCNKTYSGNTEHIIVTLRRTGASANEASGSNEAFYNTSFPIPPPTKYVLSACKNPAVSGSGYVPASLTASERLRQDDADSPSPNLSNLKEHFTDLLDNSVCMEYWIGFIITNNSSMPAVYTIGDSASSSAQNLANTLGYDLMIVNRIDEIVNGQTIQDVNLGMSWPAQDFIIISATSPDKARTFLHEIGHCVGLNDNQPALNYNIMATGQTYLRGNDISTLNQQTTKYDDGSNDWN